MDLTVGIVIQHAGGESCYLVDENFPDTTLRTKLYPGSLEHRPVGKVGAALRTSRTTEITGTCIHTLLATVTILAQDGYVGWPPVPAQLVESLGQRLP